jgi:hypothetical protein
MKMLEYADHVEALRAAHPEFADIFGGSDSLEMVLDWMEERRLPSGCVQLIGQDEYSYDFLIRLEPENRWLVFGVN